MQDGNDLTPELPEPGKAGVGEHVQISRWFLANAGIELDKGDWPQASEKVWGAVAHALKAIGEKRAWNHQTHQTVKDVGYHLAGEFGRDHFHIHLLTAEAMHQNFYRNEEDADTIREAITAARRFIAELDELREQPPRLFTVRTAADQRRLGRLLDIEPRDFQRQLPIGTYSGVGFSRNPDDNGGTAPAGGPGP